MSARLEAELNGVSRIAAVVLATPNRGTIWKFVPSRSVRMPGATFRATALRLTRPRPLQRREELDAVEGVDGGRRGVHVGLEQELLRVVAAGTDRTHRTCGLLVPAGRWDLRTLRTERTGGTGGTDRADGTDGSDEATRASGTGLATLAMPGRRSCR